MTDKLESPESPIAEFSMAISKANIDENGAMRWRSVNSDIEEDFYGERMSLELFNDFDKHIKNNESVPELFKSAVCEEDWCGGMPYLSVAHYKSGKGRVNVPGEPQSVYVDGKALKSKGILYASPLGKAVFKSLRQDIEEKSDNKVRISIGFLDLEHEHEVEGKRFVFTRKSLSDKCHLCKSGEGTKIYKKGHLVHLALTRVPANPRTDIEVEKSMTTKLEDAKSIIQDEEVEKTLELKSQVEEVLVIKAEETPAVEPVATKSFDQIAQENTVLPTAPITDTVSTTIVTPAPVSTVVQVEDNPLQKSFAALEAKMTVVKSQGLVGDNALKEIQPEFDKVGEILKAEFTPPQEVAKNDLEATLRSLLSEMLPQALAQSVAPIQAEIGELRAMSLARTPRKEEIPTQRSLSAMQLAQKSAVEKLVGKTKDQFQLLAEASVQ